MDNFSNLLTELLASVALQIGIVFLFVEWLKDTFNLKDNQVKLASFMSGAVSGSLFVWMFTEIHPELPVSVLVTLALFTVVGSGLMASGYYNFNKKRLPAG